jgi:hypothetical protein
VFLINNYINTAQLVVSNVIYVIINNKNSNAMYFHTVATDNPSIIFKCLKQALQCIFFKLYEWSSSKLFFRKYFRWCLGMGVGCTRLWTSVRMCDLLPSTWMEQLLAISQNLLCMLCLSHWWWITKLSSASATSFNKTWALMLRNLWYNSEGFLEGGNRA